MRLKKLLVIGVLLGVSGCVQHNFVPGPGAENPNGQMVSGQCKLAALNGASEPEFFAASGTPRFVAAATIGHSVGSAIGSAVRTNTLYNACMESQGYVDAPPVQ